MASERDDNPLEEVPKPLLRRSRDIRKESDSDDDIISELSYKKCKMCNEFVPLDAEGRREHSNFHRSQRKYQRMLHNDAPSPRKRRKLDSISSPSAPINVIKEKEQFEPGGRCREKGEIGQQITVYKCLLCPTNILLPADMREMHRLYRHQTCEEDEEQLTKTVDQVAVTAFTCTQCPQLVIPATEWASHSAQHKLGCLLLSGVNAD